MPKGWSNRSGFLGRPVWDGDQILLPATKTLNTVKHDSTVVIEARTLGLHRGGWLEAAVDAAQNPMAETTANHAARFVAELASNPICRAILARPVSSLQRDDVLVLFDALDKAIAVLNVKKSTARHYSQQGRQFFSTPTLQMASGDLIRDVPYRSVHRAPNQRYRDTLSDRPHPGIEDSELAQPASALQFDDVEDLLSKQLAHFRGRNHILREMCATVLDSHEFIVESISIARRMGINGLALPKSIRTYVTKNSKLPPHSFKRIPDDALLPLCVHLMDLHEFVKNPYAVRLPNRQIEIFAPLRKTGGFDEQYGLLLSEYYLTKNVLMACLTLLMLEADWNSSTTLSLTKKRVEEIDGKYYLHGYKSKSGQNQQAEISSNNLNLQTATQIEKSSGFISKIIDTEQFQHIEIETPAAVRAIRLLLKHRSNIDKYWNPEDESLFLFMSLKHKKGNPLFRIPVINKETPSFCEFIGHPRFQIEDLRKQAANTNFLETRDIRQTQAILGHAHPKTTSLYVNGSALRRTKEAVIKDFEAIMSDSYLYSAGRLTLNPAVKDRKSRLTKNLLLFPPSSLHAENGDSIADRWLNSNGTFQFEIGNNEIAHCVHQKNYYRKHCAKLAFDNSERFKTFHLPRILFCEALYRFISASPLGTKLKNLEDETHGHR